LRSGRGWFTLHPERLSEMSSRIVSVAGRSRTGATRPFLCEAADGQRFFVKGGNAGWTELVTEYVVSRLAQEYGLPVAPLSLLEIPAELALHAVVEGAHEFQPGVVFGSRGVPFGEDLRSGHLSGIPDDEKIRLLCFDWWVRNGDRSLDILGGDPGILWDPTMNAMTVIDFDRALDGDFDEVEFLRTHPFRDVLPFIEAGKLTRLRTSFESALYSLDKIWEELPSEWLVDPAGDARVDMSYRSVETTLIKPDLPVDGFLPG